MKKISLLLIISAFTFSSCRKYLEIAPSNVLALKTYEDVKSLMGSHLKMFVTSSHTLSGTTIPHWNNNALMILQFYSDDLDYEKYLSNPFGRNNRGIFEASLKWANPNIAGELWKEYYSNIGFYNTIIYELSKLNEVTEDQKNIILGEAKFLRSWYLFKLLQFFSPYKLDKYGIPVNLDPDKVGSYDTKRKTQTDVYNIIIKELEEILNYSTHPVSTYNIFYDKKIVHALLAEVYHYKGGSGAGQPGDWDKAIENAKQAMEGRTLQGLDNYNPIDFSPSSLGIFKNKPNALIVHVRDAPSNGLQLVVGIPAFGVSMLMQFATNSLYSLYDSNDVRRSYFFGDDQSILKFEHPLSISIDLRNFFSIPELYLIVTESYQRKGDNTTAKEWFENFMKNRVPGYTEYTGNDLLGAIINERRKEFCFEFDTRWCDLARLQTGWERKDITSTTEASYQLDDEDYRFCMPIPLNEELQYNKIEQNPGW